MATAVGLNMKMTADTSGIGRGMNRVERRLQGVSKSATSASRSLQTLVAIQVAGPLIRGFARAASSVIDYASSLRSGIDETAKLAQRTGIAVEALQSFQVAADLSGVQNLESAVQRLTISLGDAAAGVKEPRQALEQLGLNFEELNALVPEEQFRAVAAAFGDVGSQAERAAIAADLFGRSGVELLPLFASNLAEVEARAARLGVVLSADQTAAIEQMNDSLNLVSKTFDGIIGQVTANLAPVVTDLAEEFLAFVEGFQGVNGEIGGNALANAITDAFFSGADYLASILDPWIVSLLGWGDYFGQTTSQLGGWFEYFQTAVKLMQAAFYTVRGFFNEFVAKLADWAKLLPSLLRPDDETLDTFADGLRRSAAQDRQAASDAFMGRNRTRPNQAAGPLQTFIAQAAARRAERNSPSAQAERERERAARAAQQEQAAAAAAAKRAAEQAKKAEEERLKVIERADKAIAKAEEDRAKRAAEIEADRLDALSRRSTQALTVGDVRSGGISEVLRLATGREDPAVAESRKQLAQLQKIEQRIADLRADKVKIIGGAGRAA